MINDNGIEKIFKRMRRFKIKNSEFRTPNSELLLRNKGFTLIEIIILIVMAGILLPLIVVPFVTGIKGSGKPEMVTTAMYLAHQRMEELMKYDFQILNANSLTGPGLTPLGNAPIPNYSWQWETVHVSSDNLNAVGWVLPDSKYIRIFVRVTDPESDTYDVYSVVTNFP
jgi:type II secretory pathway pseudopilin PulG